MTINSTENVFEKVAFNKLKTHIQTSIGVNCDAYRPEYLKRRLDIRLKATNSKTYGEYYRYLVANLGENSHLLNDLTVNFTMFFRDTDVFDYLSRTIFPAVFSSSVVRIWSAGCATGEEPYSLAILVSEFLKHHPSKATVTIFATDVDKEALAFAKKGEYTINPLKGVDEGLIAKYFTKEGNIFRVKDALKSFIRFGLHDLMTPSPNKGLDVVLCRNVMIYFSRESQEKVFMHFYDSLRQSGYLVTGKSEFLGGDLAKKFACLDLKSRIYKKA